MKKKQIFKFWEALDADTSTKKTIAAFENKKGYGGKRTLERFAQAAEGFKDGLQSEVIARKTGWSVKHVNKIRSWWKQEAPKEAWGEQELREEISHEQQANEKRKLVALVQKWREEVAGYSPVTLLQGWLDKAHEQATTRFYTNEDVEMLYSEARERHAQPLQLKPFLQVENDPAFGLLRQRFPASDVWTAFHAWCERKIPYVQVLYQMLKKIECLAVDAWDSGAADVVKKGVKGVDWIDCESFLGFDKRCKLDRLFTVFVTCDLLACGIAELPSNPYWVHLTNDLGKLRLRMNVALSAVTDIPAKGGWISGVMEIRAELPHRLLELTQGFLGELAKLRLTEDSLVKALNKLERDLNVGLARRMLR